MDIRAMTGDYTKKEEAGVQYYTGEPDRNWSLNKSLNARPMRTVHHLSDSDDA